jgi:hypothetical protein
MSTAVSGVKPRAPKPWDKLRRHVRSPSWGAVSQPSSPGSPDGEPGPFHVLPDEKLQELNIASAGGSPPSARHSERAEGASAPAELAAQAAPARAGAASTPPSRVYARSKSSPGASSAPSDSAEPSRVSPVAKSDAFSKSDASATATTTVVATTTTTSASSSPEKEKEKDKDKDKDDAFQWLLTRQLEVEMSLRGSPPATQADVEATRAVFASFCEFFDALRDGARALSDRAASGAGAKAVARTSPGVKNSRAGFLVPPEDRAVPGPACEPFALFQELLHRVAGFSTRGGAEDGGGKPEDGVGSAAGTSVEVPMHQAKVLYRASVATDAVLREVDDVLGAEAVRDLVASVRRMRGVLRVKMEDANDVRMAEEAVRGARRFFDTLQRHAEQEGKSDVEVLRLLREA